MVRARLAPRSRQQVLLPPVAFDGGKRTASPEFFVLSFTDPVRW